MAIGIAKTQGEFLDAALVLADQLEQGSVYGLLAEHGHWLFGDGYFCDLFAASSKGRPSVPARVVATVMLLQSLEGLSDREAIDRLRFDLRWQAAAGLTVASVRAVDSAPLFDAVATQDTVTQLRAAIRKLLAELDRPWQARVRQALSRDDAYDTLGKPACDWGDPAAREQLVDVLVVDALAAVAVVDGAALTGRALQAAELLALVAGQDVACGEDGVFRLTRGVVRDRIISEVDTQARHGHKSRHHRFDGYKTHLAISPEDEIITGATATPANTPDRDVTADLVDDLVVDKHPTGHDDHDDGGDHHDHDHDDDASTGEDVHSARP